MSQSTRRQFILRGATQAAGVGLVLNGKLITFPPSPPPKPAGPNERVSLGFIGFGIRGNILLEAAKQTQQANLVEVCDCYQGHLERAKERTEGKIATNFARYKKLLDRKDIDAQGTGVKPAPENLEFADKPDATVLHLANFIDADRTRQPGYETAEIGHQAAAAGHMVNLSYRSGKRMLWDATQGALQA
jgi:hypothetical protein